MLKVPLGAQIEQSLKTALEKAATAQVEVILSEWIEARKKAK